MKKSSVNLFYALAVYAGVSVLFITAQLVFSGALIYMLSHAISARLLKAAARDSASFAFLTATSTILQYYLASLLSHNLRGGSGLLGVIFFSAAISSAFFIRLSAHSAFSSYIFAVLPLIVSYLLGAMAGLLQKESDNPFRNSKFNIFRID